MPRSSPGVRMTSLALRKNWMPAAIALATEMKIATSQSLRMPLITLSLPGGWGAQWMWLRVMRDSPPLRKICSHTKRRCRGHNRAPPPLRGPAEEHVVPDGPDGVPLVRPDPQLALPPLQGEPPLLVPLRDHGLNVLDAETGACKHVQGQDITKANPPFLRDVEPQLQRPVPQRGRQLPRQLLVAVTFAQKPKGEAVLRGNTPHVPDLLAGQCCGQSRGSGTARKLQRADLLIHGEMEVVRGVINNAAVVTGT
eukprot:CAMPEP_0175635612 /NCGR_PEP_ID=MMETSP0097-20121207/1778_1 /TAXON_ID=311494 /ORGANISM="Alexandrium monilatum, Strain CCMP3105" /LENGTH=252 /DNA_ID=CAMNT_0016941249 /DNA_START=166 /DNA_END=923 /DNA_ORIENTATION=-